MHGRVYKRKESPYLWTEIRLPNGQKVRQTTGTTDEAEARQILKERLKASRSMSFKEAVVNFFETRTDLKESSLRRYRVSLLAVDPFIGNMSMSDITIEVIKGFIQVRRKQVKAPTVRRDLAFISTIFSHAIENMANAPEFNPVIMLPKRSLKENPRLRWLRWEEYDRLLKSCTEDQHRLIIKTAVMTGMRHNELASLRKTMILWDRQEIILPVGVTKNGKERVVPLCAPLIAELKPHVDTAPGDLVFFHRDILTGRASPYKAFTRFWYGARRRAKLEDVRFHDLRHTFASWWVQAGGDLYPLKEVLGHSDLTMTQRYAHLNRETAHRLAKSVFEHILDTAERIRGHTEA